MTVHGLDDFDTMVRVLDPSGAELAFNDDAVGRDAQVRVLVPGGERVTIQVEGFGGRGGAYEVTVT